MTNGVEPQGTTMMRMFQMDTIGLRAERYLNFAFPPGAVSYATIVAGSPA